MLFRQLLKYFSLGGSNFGTRVLRMVEKLTADMEMMAILSGSYFKCLFELGKSELYADHLFTYGVCSSMNRDFPLLGL